MSTFYATFPNLRSARAALHEILRGGIDPDSVSLISQEANGAPAGGDPMVEEIHSVGDATAFVGREDDPRNDDLVPPSEDYTKYSSSYLSDNTMGIDTSDITTDVESIDQAEDGSEQANRDIYPPRETSHSEHERDDLNLALHTGFPTPIPVIEDQVIDADTALQDQNDDSLDTIVVPGFGSVAGRGALATAALDFINPEGDHDADRLIDHLRDEGVTKEASVTLRDAFERGSAVLAVEVVPGATDEEQVEEITERHGATNVGMFDAPRFYQGSNATPQNAGGRNS